MVPTSTFVHLFKRVELYYVTTEEKNGHDVTNCFIQNRTRARKTLKTSIILIYYYYYYLF